MELKIYNKTGNLILTASPNSSSSLTEEIGGECCVSVSFTHTSFVLLDVDNYIEVLGIRYKIKRQYRPKQKNTQTYEYSVKFYAPIHDAEDVLMLFSEGDTTSEFNYDGGPREHLQLWVDNMNRLAGKDVWSIGTVISAENKNIEYKNLNCWDAAYSSNGIAATFETEMWADGFVINLCKASHGERQELGYMQGLTNLSQEDNGEVKFFTRLFPLGSTRNIDASKYGYSRLQLPSRAKYVDKNVDLYGVKEETEEAAFSAIYPKYIGTISSVRTEEKENEEGRKYTVYYFKDNSMSFNPDDYQIPEHTYMLEFQTGELAGRGTDGSFQAAWHENTKEWEITNVYPNDTTQIPGGVIIPKPGDQYIPWNFSLPQEYTTAAEQAYELAVNNFLSNYSFDPNKYTGTTDRNYVERNNTPLRIGQNVRLLSDNYFTEYKDTRIIKVQRKLNDLCQATITCSDEVGTGWKSSVDNRLNNLQYVLSKQEQQAIIDIIKTTDSKSPSDYNVFSALKAIGMFLRKDVAEQVKYVMTFLKGIVVKGTAKFGNFITGVSGGMIDEEGNMEMESGYFRKRLFVPEIAYNRITYFKGRAVISPGGGCKVKSYIKNDDGSFTVIPDLTEADGLSQFVDDILSAFFTTKNEEGKLTGFAQMQFRVTEADYDAKTFKMVNRPGNNHEPGEEMILAQTGNFTDLDRQTYILFDTLNGNNCITFFDNANTWDPEPAQMKSWLGKKKGMTVGGIPCDNYSAVLQNILMTGLIFQVDEITGESVRVPIDMGEWDPNREGGYAYYMRVSYPGGLWLCVNPNGTTKEPGEGSVDWLLQVKDGTAGTPGASFTPCGAWISSNVPYKKNSAVEFAGNAFVALRDTSAPPFAIAKFKNGSFVRTPQGYLLAGTPSTNTLHPDWQRLTNIEPPTLYWLDSSCSSIAYTSTGSMSPSAFTVTCKKNHNGVVGKCAELWLVARKYDGSWRAHVEASQKADLHVPSASGCTQFAVRAYWTAYEANAWTDNYVAEIGIGVAEAGAAGATGAFPRDRGPWRSGESYEWSADYRDKVIHPFNGVYYNFLVRNQGSTVTQAPTSANGDANWEAMNKLVNIATDTLFADGANVAGFMFSGGVMKSQQSTGGTANMILNGTTGYFHCINADITGKINATSGTFKNISSPNGAFKIDGSGNVQITGKFQTAASGNRVVIDPSNNALSFITSGGVANCAISFGTYGGYSTANIFLRSSSGATIYDSASIAPHEIRLSDKMVSGSVKLNCNELSIVGNNKTAKFGANEISLTVGGTKYKGYTGSISYVTNVGAESTDRAYFYNGILYKIA